MTNANEPIKMSSSIVYVREADPGLLPDEIKSAPGKVFAVHDQAGNVLALAKDRSLAFAVARTKDLTPVSVH